MQQDDFSTEKPVSRGQWRALAEAALARLGEPAPTSRMDATELLVRFRVAGGDADSKPRSRAAVA